MNKHDNLLKLDINNTHKQKQQSMTTPNNVTNISKSERRRMFSKKHGTKNLISNLAVPKNHKAHYASIWKYVELNGPIEPFFRKM